MEAPLPGGRLYRGLLLVRSVNHGASAVVLGARGFIGAAVQRQLQRAGWRVRGFGSRDMDLAVSDAGARLKEVISNDQALVYAAAVTPDRVPGEEGLRRNLAMAAAVSEAIGARRPPLVVYFSSLAVYGDQTGPLFEESPATASDPYGGGKIKVEKLLQDAARGAGTRLLILRPSIVYGPGDTHTSYGASRIAREYAKGRVHLFGSGEDGRDFVFVDDVARACEHLMRSASEGVFNVASGATHTFAEVLALLGRIRPAAVEVVREPRRMPAFRQVISVKKLLDVMPSYRPVTLLDGLQQTLP